MQSAITSNINNDYCFSLISTRFLFLQSDDYISIKLSAAALDDTVGALLLGAHAPASLPIVEHEAPDPKQTLAESMLPPFPNNITKVDGSWQNVNGTR